MHRRAADIAPLQDRHRTIQRLTHSGFLEETRQHLLFALGEVLSRPVRALLEEHHRKPAGGELRRCDGTSGAGADHADVGAALEVRVALV